MFVFVPKFLPSLSVVQCTTERLEPRNGAIAERLEPELFVSTWPGTGAVRVHLAWML